ncbi:MAG: hypothetical protein NT007_00390 [Candidatus Kapabacteria bacterium]|nr:hypothetical protein [Candidatus Kapabacteria bacterium]
MIRKIKYFHPNGKKVPNGVYFQRGGYFFECRKNAQKFIVDNNHYLINSDYSISEAIHGEQYGQWKYKGGMIVFSPDVNSIVLNKDKLNNWISKKITTLKIRLFTKSIVQIIFKSCSQIHDSAEKIGSFSIGYFFQGNYISDKNKIFDEKSICLEILGIPPKPLMQLAEDIHKYFLIETVLVKDFNKDNFYLVENNRIGNSDLNSVNEKN